MSFKPCRCGFQVCVWCHSKLDGRCPHCRRNYDPTLPKFDAMVHARDLEERRKKRKLEQQSQHSEKRELDRQALRETRVIQKNVIVIMGLPPHLALEDTLRRKELCGRFGKILKLAVTTRRREAGTGADYAAASSASAHSFTAYVTFRSNAEAADCLKTLDGKRTEISSGVTASSPVLRCSFGSIRYCSNWVNGVSCPLGSRCPFLHELAKDEDIFTKMNVRLLKKRMGILPTDPDRDRAEERDRHPAHSRSQSQPHVLIEPYAETEIRQGRTEEPRPSSPAREIVVR